MDIDSLSLIGELKYSPSILELSWEIGIKRGLKSGVCMKRSIFLVELCECEILTAEESQLKVQPTYRDRLFTCYNRLDKGEISLVCQFRLSVRQESEELFGLNKWGFRHDSGSMSEIQSRCEMLRPFNAESTLMNGPHRANPWIVNPDCSLRITWSHLL
ncbi:hypothetical protein KCU90_g79, partial [Aureobasidium melanogenum]